MEAPKRIKDMPFDALFQMLISEMTKLNGFSVPLIEEIVSEFCRRFRLCKGITYLYNSLEAEQHGNGEIHSCFDTGVEGNLLKQYRVTTELMSTAVMSVYAPPDAPALTDEEEQRLDIVMRAVLTFMSRNRFQKIVREMILTDDAGYPNFRSLLHFLMEHKQVGGMIGFEYNLRHFSLVNQEFGRKAGDTALRNHFEGCRGIVGSGGTVARLGGDSFIAVCSVPELEQVLAYLAETVTVCDDTDGSSVTLTCSVGLYRFPEGMIYHDPGQFMPMIMTAFRAAQTGGKEHAVFFDHAILERKEKSMKVQQLFPEALRNREFHVFYQPKIDILTGEIAGAEALCRWFRKGEIVPPMEFIPVLEQTADICKLDFYMLDLVCSDLRRWMDSGIQPVRISVNLSRKHMMDAYLLQTILEIVDKHRIPHEYIEIELTETTTDVEFKDLKRVVGALQKAGIYTSVDDFGIGYSSLNLIRAIPWNVLKIDRSFLPLEEDSPDSTRSIMFGHVVRMAKQLGLECIAEGVETQRQVEILRDNNCDLAQGFYFDRPLPVEDFEKRLHQHYYEVT